MNKKLILSMVCASVLAMGANIASASDQRHGYKDYSDRIEKRFNHKGDRINRRLDHAAEHAHANGRNKKAHRLDRKSDKFERRLNRKEKHHDYDKHRRSYGNHRQGHHNRHHKRDYYSTYAPMGRDRHGYRNQHKHRKNHYNHRNDSYRGSIYLNHLPHFSDNVRIWLRF